MFVTKKRLSRRTLLRGTGAALALPLFDAMIPAFAATAPRPPRLAFLYAQQMIGRSLSRADRLIAVTQNTRADLVKHFDVDGRKVEVIYNGVEDVFRKKLSPEELERWRRDLGLERSYLLFVGNPEP